MTAIQVKSDADRMVFSGQLLANSGHSIEMRKENMKTYCVGLILLVMSALSHAEEQYMYVGSQCNSDKDELVLTYKIAYDDLGREIIKNLKPNQWDPSSLIIMKDDNNIGSLRTIQKQCKLADGVYKVTISPEPGNFNIQGKCGAFISASAEVRKGDRSIIKRQFDNTCEDINSPITTKIIIKSHNYLPMF